MWKGHCGRRVFSLLLSLFNCEQFHSLSTYRTSELELIIIHTENLAVSGDTTYNIRRIGRENESSECFKFATLLRPSANVDKLINERFSVNSACGQRYESICPRWERLDRSWLMLACRKVKRFRWHDLLSPALSPPCFPCILWAQFRPSVSRKNWCSHS